MMTGQQFYESLFDDVAAQREKPLSEREQITLDAVKAGNLMPIHWSPVDVPNVGARLWVSSDVLAIGVPGDFIRINVSARTQQLIADAMGFTLPTSKIADLIHTRAAFKIAPCTQPADPPDRLTMPLDHRAKLPTYVKFSSVQRHPMDSAAAGAYHSICVQAEIDSALAMCTSGQPTELFSTLGKHWALDNQCTASVAANVGWYSPAAHSVSPGGLRLIQPLSTRHNPLHLDYSQTDQAIHPIVETDDGPALLAEIQLDPVRCKWVSYGGPIKALRQPGVSRQDPVTIAPCPFPMADAVLARLLDRLTQIGA